jgi:hypothetical protein
MGPTSVLIEHNLTHVRQGIKTKNPAEMEDIAYHAQDATMGSFGQRQQEPCPDDHIVSQRPQQHQHVLGLEALCVAPGQPQPAFVALEGGFDPPATLIVEGHR